MASYEARFYRRQAIWAAHWRVAAVKQVGGARVAVTVPPRSTLQARRLGWTAARKRRKIFWQTAGSFSSRKAAGGERRFGGA